MTTATSDVQTKINALLTSSVPTLEETQTTDSSITFTHPGIGMTKAMLDNMQTHVRAYDEPWASAFVQFSGYGKSQTTPNPLRCTIGDITAFDIPSGGQGTSGYYMIRNMAQDADTAYSQFIMWYVTGNETYRINSIGIIRHWMMAESIGDIYDEQIRVSLAVFKFCLTADLLRNSTSTTSDYNWTSTDTTNFTSYLNLMKSKYNRYWHFMNQHSMCAMAYMASAIFRNDSSDYTISIKRATTNPEAGSSYDFTDPSNAHNRDGSIISQIRSVTTDVSTGTTVTANIQLVEMGRDQGHAYDDIGGLSALAMTSYIQGSKVDPTLGTLSTASDSVNMFNFLDDRLLVGANYLCKYNLGNNVTYIPCYANQTTTGQIYSAPSTSDQGTIDPMLGIIYSYYKYIEGRTDMDTNEETEYLYQAFTKIYPEGTSQDYLGDSVLFYTLS